MDQCIGIYCAHVTILPYVPFSDSCYKLYQYQHKFLGLIALHVTVPNNVAIIIHECDRYRPDTDNDEQPKI